MLEYLSSLNFKTTCDQLLDVAAWRGEEALTHSVILEGEKKKKSTAHSMNSYHVL